MYQNSQHGPVAYIVKKVSGVEWAGLVEKLEWPNLDQKFKRHVSEKLNECFQSALGFATSEKDRHILKLILSKLTSVNFLSKVGVDDMKMNKKSVQVNNIKTENAISEWTKSNAKSRYDNEKTKERLELSSVWFRKNLICSTVS